MKPQFKLFVALGVASVIAAPCFAESSSQSFADGSPVTQSAQDNQQSNTEALPTTQSQSDLASQRNSAIPQSSGGADAQNYETALGEVAPQSRLEPKTENGVTYLCGGVGIEERQKMQQVAANYDLMLTFATRRGEYLADVKVDIADAKGNAVLNANCDAPILLVDFSDKGNYRVSAETGGYSLKKIARVQDDKQKLASVIMAWPTQLAVSKDAAVTSTGGNGANPSSGESGGSETVPNE